MPCRDNSPVQTVSTNEQKKGKRIKLLDKEFNNHNNLKNVVSNGGYKLFPPAYSSTAVANKTEVGVSNDHFQLNGTSNEGGDIYNPKNDTIEAEFFYDEIDNATAPTCARQDEMSLNRAVTDNLSVVVYQSNPDTNLTPIYVEPESIRQSSCSLRSKWRLFSYTININKKKYFHNNNNNINYTNNDFNNNKNNDNNYNNNDDEKPNTNNKDVNNNVNNNNNNYSSNNYTINNNNNIINNNNNDNNNNNNTIIIIIIIIINIKNNNNVVDNNNDNSNNDNDNNN